MTDKGNSINIDGHECYGFGDPYFLNTGVFTGELKKRLYYSCKCILQGQ